MAIKKIELLKWFASNEEMMEVLTAVATDLGDVIEDVNSLVVIPLKGAMTNEVFQINWPTKSDGHLRRVLVRLYGEGVEVFFNREVEIQTFECMSRHGHGPRLLGRFPTGRVEEFIHARTLSAVDLRDPAISALIATKMRDFHNLHMPGAKKAQLWQRMRNWVNHAKSLCSPKDAKNFGLDKLDAEINILEVLLSEGYEEIGFCHNDLQYGNIMIDEETRSITLIDYEYASYNPIAYDLANHFCEMTANYHSDNPHVLDYSKYPGKKPSNIEVEQLVTAAEKYTLANHLFWGLWGVISTLSAVDLRDPAISALIATKMRDFHNLHMPGAKKAQLWQRMRNWVNHAKSLCSPKDAKNFGLDKLDAEINILEVLLSEGYEEIGFCHNDLQYGNIMIDEETRSITLIDYEYASYNPIAYDLANHFCEMTANYHSDNPHVLDYSKYPGKKPSNIEVEQLVTAAEKYTLANHLFWGLWGVISSYVNTIDFDYKEYARQRFQQYWLKKPTLLDSSRIISQDGNVNNIS
ncbi:hypothetical protein TanjilG_21370 [Lupinus angustifolius]|uniref:Aminoglycoside phosphotransferase domain-containing protein n=1 Tax=Lupinus angustifolius TaxID=3871 RepID=A0A4P1RNB9_LUPAN|nr:hypothetical protein TanjilG_21370 [Lupinus angustifolius]